VKRVAFESYEELVSLRDEAKAVSIPVIVRIEPGRFAGKDTQEALDFMNKIFEKRIEGGMRATLKLANLLTGAKMIAIDHYPDATPVKLQKVEGMRVIPTIGSDVDMIAHKVSQILNKVNRIQFEKISNDTDQVLQNISLAANSANKAIIELNNLLANEATQNIPKALDESLIQLKEVLEGFSPDTDLYRDLNNSIKQLNETLRNLEGVTHTMDSKPSSLIFSDPRPADIQPEVSK
jgi:paraquat-inducible protein B